MQICAVIRLVSLLVMLFSVTLIPPMVVDLIYDEHMLGRFFVTLLCALAVGGFGWLLTRRQTQDLKVRDGFMVVTLFWVVLSLFGMLPFVLGQQPTLGLLDGFYESVSGWTTTGSTMLLGIEFLPHSLQYYRQQLQFLGGMGIIVLAVAILPMLGVGGMQLYQAEMPGPMKDHKLTPRIAETAKALWAIYVGLTLVCALAYGLAGMPWFNALGEAFSTVATGGFSMHDASFGYYDSSIINGIAVVFMILSSFNYGLHYVGIRRGHVGGYLSDLECRRYVSALFLVCALVVTVLIVSGVYLDHEQALVHGIFNTVSIMTTTGLTTTNYQEWPAVLPILLMLMGIVGGCAASTSGGMKMIRIVLMRRQSLLAFKRLMHPKAIYALRIGDKPVSEKVLQAVSAFVFIFLSLFFFLWLLLIAFGVDFKTAFGCLVACLANVGVGVGDTLPNLAHFSSPCKVILIFAMLAGRLEIFTLLILFLPEYWQK
jgi:trk system potassium uptake protein